MKNYIFANRYCQLPNSCCLLHVFMALEASELDTLINAKLIPMLNNRRLLAVLRKLQIVYLRMRLRIIRTITTFILILLKLLPRGVGHDITIIASRVRSYCKFCYRVQFQLTVMFIAIFTFRNSKSLMQKSFQVPSPI